MKTTHEIVFCDSRNLNFLPDNSIHLIITSPPYWDRKNYDHDDQIGFGQTYDNYLDSLKLVISELFRVLVSGRKMCVIVGDLYQSSKEHGRYKVISLSSDIIRISESLGFDYYGSIIWQKICKTKPSGGVHGCFMGSYPFPPNGIVTLDYEYILLFKIPGPSQKISKEIRYQSKITKREWEIFFTGHWRIPGNRYKEHPATFPIIIPRRLIDMYSFVGETVLDPFVGSGTTTLAARIQNRNSIGCELNKEKYWPIIKKKIGFNQKDLFNECKFKINTIRNGDKHRGEEEEPATSPYPASYKKKTKELNKTRKV